MFEEKKECEREANLNSEVVEKLREVYKKYIAPEEVFYYIYGIFYSSIYREKYKEFLKIDFPRIPFTSDYDLFIQIGKFGEKLINLHLFK